jgi:hypothetical protein
VLFADETEVGRFPPLRRMRQSVGEQKAAWGPEQNGHFALYGALNACIENQGGLAGLRLEGAVDPTGGSSSLVRLVGRSRSSGPLLSRIRLGRKRSEFIDSHYAGSGGGAT